MAVPSLASLALMPPLLFSGTALMLGALGALVSMTMARALLWADSLPAASVMVVLMLWAPSARGLVGVRVLVRLSNVAATLTPST